MPFFHVMNGFQSANVIYCTKDIWTWKGCFSLLSQGSSKRAV
jgi:hypothetical protein